MKQQKDNQDEGLKGNEKIEEAIAGLQQEPTQEMLAHALTVVRRRMKENGQLIVAVEPPAGGGQLLLQTVKTSDGKLWWAAFTGFEEELRGSDGQPNGWYFTERYVFQDFRDFSPDPTECAVYIVRQNEKALFDEADYLITDFGNFAAVYPRYWAE